MQERETAVTTNSSSAVGSDTGLSGQATTGQAGQSGSAPSAQRVREQAQNLGREAGERGTEMLEERKGWVTNEVRSVAQALHRSGDQLDAEGSQAGPYAHWVADALDRVSAHLQQNDMKALLRETQAFARREPGLVIGGALAIGFALTRFLKSSETHDASSVTTSEERMSRH